MMYLLALAIAVDIACIFIVAGGNRFDDYVMRRNNYGSRSIL